jgi:hypothetical protein
MRAWILLMTTFVIMSLLPLDCQASVSLGSAQGSKHANINQGEEVDFTVYLFNVHQEGGMNIYTGVQEDGGLSVRISPESLEVPYSEPGRHDNDEGFSIIRTSSGYVRAVPVTVNVRVPLSSQEGRYEVSVYAATEKQAGAVGAAQTRRFSFTVDVGEGESLNLGEEMSTEAGVEPDIEGGRDDSNPEESVEEEKDAGSTDNAIDSITGAVTSTYVIGPFLLIGVVALFMVLRRLKRI